MMMLRHTGHSQEAYSGDYLSSLDTTENKKLSLPTKIWKNKILNGESIILSKEGTAPFLSLFQFPLSISLFLFYSTLICFNKYSVVLSENDKTTVHYLSPLKHTESFFFLKVKRNLTYIGLRARCTGFSSSNYRFIYMMW